MSLQEHLLNPTNRAPLTRDCVAMLGREIAKKSGLSGLAVRGVLAVVNKVDPDFLPKAVDLLLEDFVDRLSPFYQTYTETPDTEFTAFIYAESDAVTVALLGVTDRRLENVQTPALKAAYRKLRPTASKHVKAAVPAIARVIQTYIP